MTDDLPRFRIRDQDAGRPRDKIGEFRFLIERRHPWGVWLPTAAAHDREDAQVILDALEAEERRREEAERVEDEVRNAM